LAWAGVDALVWVGALLLATTLRYEAFYQPAGWRELSLVAMAAIVLQVMVGFWTGPYGIGHTRGSYEEILDVIKTVIIVAFLVTLLNLLLHPNLLARSVPPIAFAFALVGMLALRLVVREWKARNGHAHRADRVEQPRRTIIFGAGEGGRVLSRALARDRARRYEPVALIDDDPLKSRLTLEGVKVRGARGDLERVAERFDADTLAIAVPSAAPELIQDLSERAERAGLEVMILPPVTDMITSPGAGDLRNLDLADLLGRRAVQLDTTAIANAISGKRVLVTGAGGSIGSELCRQIQRFGPASLFALDRDESALHAVQLTISGSGLFDHDGSVLVDIRDLDALKEAFSSLRPDIVFHTAALKHLPLLETYPLEGFKSNVLGTRNVLEASVHSGVGTVVNISTDKAADPTSVLGYTKRVAERLTAGFAKQHSDRRFVSVRFGNVLGSRGSVVPAFTAQIERGGPVTVTHPDVERYFMLIPEACQLVLEAAAAAPGRGEVMVLDMGVPQKIVTIAKALIRMSGRNDVEIVYTGLRPGEKMSEDLVARAEDEEATANPLVTAASVAPLDPMSVPVEQIADHERAKRWSRETAASVEEQALKVDDARLADHDE
jgi:FlaA1/EpsC-like NDP-sugar epimerase